MSVDSGRSEKRWAERNRATLQRLLRRVADSLIPPPRLVLVPDSATGIFVPDAYRKRSWGTGEPTTVIAISRAGLAEPVRVEVPTVSRSPMLDTVLVHSIRTAPILRLLDSLAMHLGAPPWAFRLRPTFYRDEGVVRVPIGHTWVSLWEYQRVEALPPRGPLPEFPELAEHDEWVDVQFVIDVAGEADMASVQLLSATDHKLTLAARQLLAVQAYRPASVGGCAYRQLVQQRVHFRVPRTAFRRARPRG